MARAVEAGKLIIGAIAVCTDPTGAAAATLGCDTLLQGKAWFERKPDVAKLAAELDAAFAKRLDEPRFDKPNDARTLLPQMLERVVFSEQMIVECDLDPDRIFDGFKARLKTDRAEYNSKAMLDAFEALTRPLLEKACRDKRLADAFAPLLHRKQLQYGREARDEARETNAMLSQIASRLKDSPALSLEARELARQERLINEISERYLAATPDDPMQALEGIAAMLERLSQQLARDETGSNFSRDFDEILREVDRLILEEGADKAARRLIRIKDGIATREQKLAAEKTALIGKQILIAGLRNEPKTAALLHAENLEIEVGQRPTVRDLEKRGIELSQEYERTGVLFDGETAVAIFRLALERARPEDAPDVILGNLAISHLKVGKRDSRPLHLLQAIEFFQQHESMVPRTLLPNEWSNSKNSLGNALLALGERESGTDRLEQAVIAFREALEERSRDTAPRLWAVTQNNLGGALLVLSQRETGTDVLKQAIAAFHEALKENTRDRVPFDWAMTQNNLAAAFGSLGARERSRDWLEKAVCAFREALKEYTRDRAPLDWAMTQHNLGNVLMTLGELEKSTDSLDAAVRAYREALKERTRDRLPLGWASTVCMCASAEALIAERTEDQEKAKAALPAAEEALHVLREGGHEVWAKTASNAITQIQAIIARLSTPKP